MKAIYNYMKLSEEKKNILATENALKKKNHKGNFNITLQTEYP